MSREGEKKSFSKQSALVAAAMGIVFGDIGTSPLYTLKEVFAGVFRIPLNEANVLGVLSLITWSLIVVVSLKYILFVMSASNNGEGGIMALTALALRNRRGSSRKLFTITGLGIFATGLFYGDSIITPAISVLSAIEGLNVAEEELADFVLPLTVAVVVLLFFFQYRGTAFVGRYFGPIMLTWFFTIGAMGLLSIAKHPFILKALNPYYAWLFFFDNKAIFLTALGSTFLALTGAEALYADMGHFGPKPIRQAWFAAVLPALLLNYFGQGALLIENPSAIKNPFYLLARGELLYPLVALSTIATIVASQAVITGAFSMTQEAIRLGYLPRLEVHYTSSEEKGQIYIPTINWLLFAAVIFMVLQFKSSAHLAAAYGLSVTGTMIITTLLAYGVLRDLFSGHRALIAACFALFFVADLAFLAANCIKIEDGGWVPLLIALMIFLLMTTWRRGIEMINRSINREPLLLQNFLDNISEIESIPIPGTGIFFTSDLSHVPRALLVNLHHNKVLHERVVIAKVKIVDRPHVNISDLIEIHPLSHGFYTVVLTYGYKDPIDIPKGLAECEKRGLAIPISDVTYYIGKETPICSTAVKLAKWRKRLFIGMYRNASSFTSFCKIPLNSAVELGAMIEF